MAVFKLTTDDWCGSYTITDGHNKLKGVIVYKSLLEDNTYSVSVWGTDDLGMEKDCSSLEEADLVFNQVVALPFVQLEGLSKMGFVSA